MEKNSGITNAYGTFHGLVHRHENKTIPWLIFLHGFPDDSSVWSYQIDSLKDRFQIWAPDLYQHSYHTQIEGISEFLKSIKPDADIFMISHDIGGPVACTIAEKYPELVSKLFLINTLSLRMFFKRWKQPKQWMKSSYMTLFIGPMYATDWWKKLAGLFLKTAYDLGEVSPDDPLRKHSPDSLEGIKRYREYAKEIPKLAKESKIKVEGHFLFGSRDAFLMPPDKKEVLDHFEKCSIELIEAGHWPQRTHADEVSDWITRNI